MAEITKMSWAEFRRTGALWFANRLLHLMGMAIVFEMEDGEVKSVYPARVSFRGFIEKMEQEGFIQVTEYMAREGRALLREAKE